MELGFVVGAVRRRWWLVVVGALLAAAAALPFVASGASGYKSTTTLTVVPPSDQRLQNSDRFVASQIAAMKSDAVLATAAHDLGVNADDLARRVAVSQVAGTDLIAVTASGASGEEAQHTSGVYVDKFVAAQQADADQQQQTQVSALEHQIADVQGQLTVLNASIADLVDRYRAGAGTSTLPPVEVIAPEAASERDAKQAEYVDLVSARTQLVFNSGLRPTTQIVQTASNPVRASSSSAALKLFGALGFLGAVVGGCAAVVSGRVSRPVRVAETVEELIGAPLLGSLRLRAGLQLDEAGAIERPRSGEVSLLDEVLVRAEATVGSANSLCLVVTGTERGVGASTTAVALAGRFRAAGAHVSLIDCDDRYLDLSDRIEGAVPARRIQAQLLDDPSSGGLRQTWFDMGDPSQGNGDRPLRRQAIPRVLDAARAVADVVVVDAGPLLESPAAPHVCALADAVVLAVGPRQSVDTLRRGASQLSDLAASVLPITVTVRRSGRRRAARTAARRQHEVARRGFEARGGQRPREAATAQS